MNPPCELLYLWERIFWKSIKGLIHKFYCISCLSNYWSWGRRHSNPLILTSLTVLKTGTMIISHRESQHFSTVREKPMSPPASYQIETNLHHSRRDILLHPPLNIILHLKKKKGSKSGQTCLWKVNDSHRFILHY